MKISKKESFYVSLGLVILLVIVFNFKNLHKSVATNNLMTNVTKKIPNPPKDIQPSINEKNNKISKEIADKKKEIKIEIDKKFVKNKTKLHHISEAELAKLANKKIKLADKKIKGMVALKAKVEKAKNVEFYLTDKKSNVDKYIGSARKMENKKDDWKLDFDTNSFPNGSFYLKAKIKDSLGNNHESDKKSFNIDNGVVSTISNQVSANDTTKVNKLLKDSQINNKQKKKEVNFNGSISQSWQKKFFHQSVCQNKNVCGSEADPDKDGLTNNEEFQYKTDPLSPDSDKDGYLDGDEIKNGFNPLKYSPGDKSDRIVFESPQKKGVVKKDLYKVTSVKLKKESNKKETLVLSGKGLPNSFVTIYIYSSQPIILTVKTDKNGNWSYALDKKLENGEHHAYVAVTDNTGKITAKSEPLAFIKTAQAVSAVSDKTYVDTASLANKDKKNGIAMVIAFTLISLGLAISVIGLVIAKFRKK